MTSHGLITAVVPAAGVGSRMQADRPKQYLQLAGKTVLEHTLEALISHPRIGQIIVAVSPQDDYFDTLPVASADWLLKVTGGKERADSVLSGLMHAEDSEWVLVHDAARPCVTHADLDRLLALTTADSNGGILATPVRDTMKRASPSQPTQVAKTESRDHLWHALTPQLFRHIALRDALASALKQGVQITDEASAIEWAGGQVELVEGSATNIKITRPDDLALAAFYINQRTA